MHKRIVSLLGLFLLVTLASCQDPSRFLAYLEKNIYQPGCAEVPILPLSYHVSPSTYFEDIPPNLRIPPHEKYTEAMKVAACGDELIPPHLLNEYEFQTEKFLTLLGLNIYDGSVWSIAISLLGNTGFALAYESNVLRADRTCQFENIMGDRACVGVINQNECKDPEEIGACGFCYGDGPGDRTLSPPQAWFFRMISSVYAVQGAYDIRCPEKKILWTWNDYKPVLGENSWSRLIGPVQAAYLRSGRNIQAIPDSDLMLPLNFLPSLVQMLVPSIGAVHYAPYNTWSFSGIDDTSISSENQISVLSGLASLLHLLKVKGTHQDLWPTIENLRDNIVRYLKSAYDKELGYFRQGGHYNASTGKFTWVPEPFFAVDCQTWILSVLGPKLIDSWFGENTALNIWKVTKQIGGYKLNPVTGRVKGVGFSNNVKDQVFSGEWTFGAINMLRVLSNEYTDPTIRAELDTEAAEMRAAIEAELTVTQNINGVNAPGVLYANKRYYIPFGWWANSLVATASTGWAVAVDKNYNPFYLTGAYTTYF
eukprot:TRINITY_DN815_c0_g1_i1.p1 TRINITY_DN815_c0_g1~~TRINITY_DN815_c0_g1_i1.p1  ORF type:complete len:551 (-),score=100.74 TRINITY_DN815_c0_g1_i1:31-1641(-)